MISGIHREYRVYIGYIGYIGIVIGTQTMIV